MSEPRLLVPGPFPEALAVPSNPTPTIELDAERSNYLCRVLRRRHHDPIRLFDGRGSEHLGTVERADPRRATVTVGKLNRQEAPPPHQLHLAQALLKGERFDWALQKATELGATRITPVITERTEVRLSGERRQRRMNHWVKVLESATEQSDRLWLPHLDAPIPLHEFLDWPAATGVFLTPGAPAFKPPAAPTNLLVLIGPEGGLSQAERGRCEGAGLTAAGLGKLVLRAETAPLAVLAAVRSTWGWQ
jgi:16S rRNA (uracil1498-N3)-methyltransferase